MLRDSESKFDGAPVSPVSGCLVKKKDSSFEKEKMLVGSVACSFAS